MTACIPLVFSCIPSSPKENTAMKRWMIVTVENGIEWPSQEMTHPFAGRALILRPSDKETAADVRLEYEHPDEERDAFETICRFLSTFSWWQHRPARAQYRLTCSAPTLRGGKGAHGLPTRRDYQIPDAVSLHPDRKARIAMALYREAGSVRGTPYEFLAYFKVINMLYKDWHDQVKWINKTLPSLTDNDANDRVSKLRALESDIGLYLYTSGRCAVAHAFNDPMVDPDDPTDLFRLGADMPVVKALAEYLIEHEYGIKWESSKK
jgi:hypothetical protein